MNDVISPNITGSCVPHSVIPLVEVVYNVNVFYKMNISRVRINGTIQMFSNIYHVNFE